MVRIIDDTNWRSFVAHERGSGILAGALPRETPLGGLPCATAGEPVPIIPEVEWKERIAEMTAKKLWPQDAYDACSPALQYQDGLPYCWAFSFAQTIEVVRASCGLPYIQLAPESLGGVVNYRNVGNSLDSTIAWASRHGLCRRSMVPDLSRNPKEWTAGWQDDCLNFVPEEWFDLGSTDVWAEAVSALLGRLPPYVGLSWWGHAVAYTKLVVEGGEVCPYTPNTHGKGQDRILKGSRKVPDIGCFVPRRVTWYEGTAAAVPVEGIIGDTKGILRDVREILDAVRTKGINIRLGQ